MNRRLRSASSACGLAAVLLVAGCARSPQYTEPMQLGGVMVSPDVLEKGHETYVLYCRACHGDAGKGDGPASHGLRPPPRDLTAATFKFGWVVDGLPRDEDLKRIIQSGLHGTAMLEWQVPADRVDPLIAYVKSLAPGEWADPILGEPVVAAADPFGEARAAQAAERGRQVYHGVAQCWTCHPAYATRQYIAEQRGVVSFRPDMYYGEPKESSYKAADGTVLDIMPPDFTFSPLRSIRAGSEVSDLFSVIGAGIPGSGMPAWKGSLPDEDIWAMAYYVHSLMGLRDTQQARQMRQELLGQPEWAPPPPAPAEGAPAEGTPPPSESGL